jgi:hypothetical protein
MRPLLCCVMLISWLTFVRAQNRFDGIWKAEPTECATSAKPDVYL